MTVDGGNHFDLVVSVTGEVAADVDAVAVAGGATGRRGVASHVSPMTSDKSAAGDISLGGVQGAVINRRSGGAVTLVTLDCGNGFR